jgi:hypothetical protein
LCSSPTKVLGKWSSEFEVASIPLKENASTRSP